MGNELEEIRFDRQPSFELLLTAHKMADIISGFEKRLPE
jgi:hypothetical protein